MINPDDDEAKPMLDAKDPVKPQDKRDYRKEAEDAANEGAAKAVEFINLTNDVIKIVGSPSQNSLIVLALQLSIASLLLLLINQIEFLVWILGFLKPLNYFNFLIFAIILGLVQFGTKLTAIVPMNFIMFVVHTSWKVLFLVLYGSQHVESRFDVFYMLIVFGILYVLVIVKHAESGNGDWTVKGNFYHITFLGIVLSVYLCLLAKAGFGPLVWIPVAGVLYGFFLLLAVQRLPSIEYLRQNHNSIFLGAAQLDADLLFFCPLAMYHLKKKTEEGQAPEGQALPEGEVLPEGGQPQEQPQPQEVAVNVNPA